MFSEIFKCLSFVLLLVIMKTVDCDTNNCNCKPLRQCPTFIKYLRTLEKPLKQTTVEFIRGQKCGYQDGYPKICCLNSYTNNPLLRNKPPPGKRCNSTSECVILKDCVPFMTFINSIEKPLKPTVVKFLRNQECGFEKGYPKVCCGKVPRNLRVLKHYRLNPRVPVNVLSAPMETNDNGMTDLFRIVNKENIQASTTKSQDLRKKSEAMNKQFASMQFMDFTDGFDLMIRKKRSDVGAFVDVEIR